MTEAERKRILDAWAARTQQGFQGQSAAMQTDVDAYMRNLLQRQYSVAGRPMSALPSVIGGGAAAGLGNSVGSVLDQYNAKQEEAKAANEKRYQDILSLLGSIGGQQKSDIAQQYKNLAGAGEQDLISRGLAGTTVLPTMRAGLAQQEAEAQARLAESLANQRAGFMERRSDTSPDQGALLNVMQAYGKAGGGAGQPLVNIANPMPGQGRTNLTPTLPGRPGVGMNPGYQPDQGQNNARGIEPWMSGPPQASYPAPGNPAGPVTAAQQAAALAQARGMRQFMGQSILDRYAFKGY